MGYELALQFANAGHNVLAISRKIPQTLLENSNITCLSVDLSHENELQKVKNKTESMIAYEDMTVMSRAASLAYYELLGDASWINTELEKYNSVTTVDILQECRNIFSESNSNTLYYYAN